MLACGRCYGFIIDVMWFGIECLECELSLIELGEAPSCT